MGTFLVYLAKSSIVLALLYLFNNLLLSRDTFHRFNRAWWLASIVLSCALPFLTFGREASGTVPVADLFADEAVGHAVASGAAHPENLALTRTVTVLFLIYIAGVVFFAVLFLISSIRLRRQCQACAKERRGGINVYICEGETVPFSWGRNIMISRGDLEEGNEVILAHEMAHIRLHHTLDILLCNLLIVFQWFNPCSWLTKRSLQKVHEFQADEAVVRSGVNLKNYQLLLIRKAVGHRLYSMANSFNHNDLKSRITMMSKTKSNKWAYAKALYVLPAALIVATAFSTPQVVEKCDEISTVKVTDSFQKEQTGLYAANLDSVRVLAEGKELEPVVVIGYGDTSRITVRKADGDSKSTVLYVGPSDEPLYIVDGEVKDKLDVKTEDIESITVLKGSAAVEQYGEKGRKGVILVTMKGEDEEVIPYAKVEVKPSFNGGDANVFSNYVCMKLVYPESAKKKGISGRVTLSFIIGTDGVVGDVKVLRGVNPELDAEAVRVVAASPKWTAGKSGGKPVAVRFVFPVIFSLR